MQIDPRTALDRLIGAFEAFHDASAQAQDPEAESVLEASDRLADAYIIYDEAMFTNFGVETPFDIYDDDEDEDDDDIYDYDDDDDLDDDFDDDDLDDSDIDEDDLDVL